MEELGPKVQHLISSLQSFSLVGDENAFALTNYLMFMVLAGLVLVVFFSVARRNTGLVPQGRIANMGETLVGYVRSDIAGEIIGHGSERYWPFIASVFFFVLFNNLLGLIPGFKPGTGSIGVTISISLIVFIYFNYEGIRAKGGWKYITGLVPQGVPGWIAWLVWIIEFISMMIRPLTLAIRLFANMYAGHMVLGVFALLVELAISPVLNQFSAGGLIANGAMSLGWLALLTALWALEVLVAFIQAYVFTLLTTVYIGSAVHDH